MSFISLLHYFACIKNFWIFEFENFGRYNPRWKFASPPGQFPTTRLSYAEPFQCPISGILRLRILEREQYFDKEWNRTVS